MSFESITGNPARCANVVPGDRFDRHRLPNFALYSPDMCHDGHDVCGSAFEHVKGSIGDIPGARRVGLGSTRQLDQAAAWLGGFLEPILADPAVMKDTLVVVTFDESEDDANNTTPCSSAGWFALARSWTRATTTTTCCARSRTTSGSERSGRRTRGRAIVGDVWRERREP